MLFKKKDTISNMHVIKNMTYLNVCYFIVLTKTILKYYNINKHFYTTV